MVLGQAAAQAGELLEVGFAGFGALVVGDAGHDYAARRAQRQRPREQRARFLALARRQHQHQRIPRVRRGRIGDHLQAATLQFVGERLVTLFADQLRKRPLPHRPAFARAQEQHCAFRPRERAVGER